MTQADYILVIKGLLMLQSLEDVDQTQIKKLINHYDTLYQKAEQ